uniref:CCN family member 1 n=1 Tax=Monopterus albus TaxID=43700 RepID=A0A3Q3KLZ5_MONAL
IPLIVVKHLFSPRTAQICSENTGCCDLPQVSASCLANCQCPREVPKCAAGVSLILDSCGCCKVCAQQLFEDCSKTQPCDHTKGLECNLGGGSAKGVCRAKSAGRTCEYNSKIYQNGEIFRPNCKHQCTCVDGVVGCVSLCPSELSLLRLGWAKPGEVKVQGWCCKQLAYSKDAKKESSVEKNRKKHIVCVSQTTAWSPCSKSCGTGVSSRTTNRNTQCKLVRETRLCKVRTCNQMTFILSMNCRFSAFKMSYSGCRSLKKFQPIYCGCRSDGRCCRPHRTWTIRVRFQCKNGEIITRMLMMIKSCKCNHNSSGGNEKSPALYGLFNDIHSENVKER